MTVELERREAGARRVVWAGSTDSNEVIITPGSVGSLTLPPTFTGTTLQVKAKDADGTFQLVYDGGVALAITVAANGRNIMPPELLCVNGTVKFVSDQSETCEGSYYPVR